jgi:hypothetical protein
MKILNIPNEEYIYEFMVVKFLMNDKNGEAIYGFRRNFENGFLADEYASAIGGKVIHRVRIQGKKRRIGK